MWYLLFYYSKPLDESKPQEQSVFIFPFLHCVPIVLGSVKYLCDVGDHFQLRGQSFPEEHTRPCQRGPCNWNVFLHRFTPSIICTALSVDLYRTRLQCRTLKLSDVFGAARALKKNQGASHGGLVFLGLEHMTILSIHWATITSTTSLH